MSPYEKENEEKKRVKAFFYIKEQLSVFIQFVDIFEKKLVINKKKEKEDILNFLYSIVKDVESVLEKDFNV